MTKFLKFCIAFLGLDLFFGWITSSRGKTSIQNFFSDLGKVGLSIILLHIIGVLTLGIFTDNNFFGQYLVFLKSWDTVKHYEYFLGLGILVAVGVMTVMLMISAIIAAFLSIAFTIAIPVSVYQWGKRKWSEVYGTKPPEEEYVDDEDEDSECSTCEEVR